MWIIVLLLLVLVLVVSSFGIYYIFFRNKFKIYQTLIPSKPVIMEDGTEVTKLELIDPPKTSLPRYYVTFKKKNQDPFTLILYMTIESRGSSGVYLGMQDNERNWTIFLKNNILYAKNTNDTSDPDGTWVSSLLKISESQ